MADTSASLERLAHDLLDAFDALDMKRMTALMAQDIQGVDEISRRWLRGIDSIGEYFGMLEQMGVTDPKTTISDLHAWEREGIGVATLMTDQTYRAGGETIHVTAPMTLIARNEDGAWKIAVIHAVGLPTE